MSRKMPPISTEKTRDVDVEGLDCHAFTATDEKILAGNKYGKPEKEYVKEEISFISNDRMTAFPVNCEVTQFDPLTYTRDRDEMKETVMEASFINRAMKPGESVYIGDGFSFKRDNFKKLLELVSSFENFDPDKLSVFHGGRGTSSVPARLTFIDSKKKKYITAVTVPLLMNEQMDYERVISSDPCDPLTVGKFLPAFREETEYQLGEADEEERDPVPAPVPANIFVSNEFDARSIKEMDPMDFFKALREIVFDPYFDEDDDFFDRSMDLDTFLSHPRFKELIGYVHACGVSPNSKECNDDLCLIKTGKDGGIVHEGVLIARDPLEQGKTTETCSPWKEASRDNYSKKDIAEDVRLLSKLTSVTQKGIKDGLTICHVENETGTGFDKFVANDFIAYKGAYSLLEDFVSSIPTKPNTLPEYARYTYGDSPG